MSPAVVILAGGQGERIGGNKPSRLLAGERLVDRALRLARSWSDVVAVAVRDPDQVEQVNAAIIRDDPAIAGPLAGLVSALRFAAAAERDLVLTIPTDMPFLPPDLLDRLESAIVDRACAIAGSGGHRHPVCGLWRTGALDSIEDYLAGERRSLMGFAGLVGFGEVDWLAQPSDPFLNINSPAELARAERLARA